MAQPSDGELAEIDIRHVIKDLKYFRRLTRRQIRDLQESGNKYKEDIAELEAEIERLDEQLQKMRSLLRQGNS